VRGAREFLHDSRRLTESAASGAGLARGLKKRKNVSAITNSAEPARSRGSVLIVDDEKGPRESLRMILRPAYEVHTASDGHEALEILRSHQIDCLTLDLHMPGLAGEELMRIVKRTFPGLEVIVITGYGSVETATLGLRHGICDYIQKPFDVVKVSAAVTRAFSRQNGRRQLAGFLNRLGEVVGRAEEVERILQRVEQAPGIQTQVVDLLDDLGALTARPESAERVRSADFLAVLAETIESQHDFLHGHAQRTSYYSGLLAERAGLSWREQEHVRIAAFMHDVGKIGVPTELLLRPGALDPSERKAIERHSVIGESLLEPLGLPSEVIRGVRHHHEWWDGRGYPDGLRGEQIPLLARIVAIADAYDAMSSDRPYRRALAPEVVIEQLRSYAGVQFDEALSKEFLRIVESSEVDLQLVADTVAGGAGWRAAETRRAAQGEVR
jgi:response regulator RpfG family c-di-GMP phosphodiesterase